MDVTGSLFFESIANIDFFSAAHILQQHRYCKMKTSEKKQTKKMKIKQEVDNISTVFLWGEKQVS